MQVLIVIIEKDGDTYIGRSPNLLGVSVTTKTRDEAETAILDAMDNRIIELNGMHSYPKPISRRPIEETMYCVYVDAPGKEPECSQSGKKDGLCLIHWRKLYGHPYSNTLQSCPLCSESDKNVLADYGSLCSFKIENSDWANIFEEMKVKMGSKWAKERRQVRIKRFGS
jgi:predicted RNase H-like HicB family nuclease